MKMIAQITKPVMAKIMKISHNSAPKAAILDFGKGQIFPKCPFYDYLSACQK